MSLQDKVDACGIFCIIFVYLSLIYSNYAFFTYVMFYNDINIIKCLTSFFYELIVIFITWSHLKASFADPGVWFCAHNLDFSSDQLSLLNNDLENRESLNRDDSWTICTKCETYRPNDTHHCSTCNRCIKKMDHHCPWINNCVGEKNQKYFLQFLFYVGFLCIVTLISIFIEFLDINRNQSQIRALHCIILLIESLLFGIFVIAVFVDQVHDGESSIDRYKNIRKRKIKIKKRNTFKEVCGRKSIMWLLPIETDTYRKLDNFVV